MNISKNKVVCLSYELRTSIDGEIIEKVEKESPLTFIFGRGNMLAKFEQNLEGMTIGNPFNFKLAVQDAYGEYSEEAVVEVPKDIFMADGKTNDNLLAVGNIIPLQDNQGNRFNGKVLQIADKIVTIDLNHPLADQELFFNGEIVDVREPSVEELEHGHVHHECTHCGKH